MESNVIEELDEGESYIQPSVKKRISLLWAKDAIVKNPEVKRGKRKGTKTTVSDTIPAKQECTQNTDQQSIPSNIKQETFDTKEQTETQEKKQKQPKPSEFDKLLAEQKKRAKSSVKSSKNIAETTIQSSDNSMESDSGIKLKTRNQMNKARRRERQKES